MESTFDRAETKVVGQVVLPARDAVPDDDRNQRVLALRRHGEALRIVENSVVAVAQSMEVSGELRATVERQYNELIERLDRAEDNPHAAIGAFGQLVRFIELTIELSLKFGGQLQGIWQGTARPIIVPLLH